MLRSINLSIQIVGIIKRVVNILLSYNFYV
nr:MAG TPA: hypothetical protein [Caudoviricetes sp.]